MTDSRDHQQILLTLDYYFEEKIFDGSYDSAKEVLAEAGLPYERLPQIMRTLREMDAAGELEERYGSGRLTPNRALTRASLERLAWQVTPEEERSPTGRSVLQRRGEERGVTRVPLSSMTDHQLRAYIGPGVLEEAGDMNRNSGETGAVEAFKADLIRALDIGDRQIFFRDGAYGRVFINFYNVPPPHRGASAEGENNRLMIDVVGLESAAGKVRVELAVRGPSFGADYKLRAKTATVDAAIRYIAEYLNRAARKAPYGLAFERNARRGEEADETAARELSLFIENDYALVGAPNSQGKSIEANLLRKIKNGYFDLKLSEQAWMYLMESGAKKYAKEFGDGESAWSKMFNKPTRELVAHEFATTFYEEHKLNANGRSRKEPAPTNSEFFAAYKRAGGPSEHSTLAAVDESANSAGRALIADVRAKMGGTREQQDALLTQLQRDGKIVLYANDVPRSVTEHEASGGIQFGDPSIARPRTIVYRLARNGSSAATGPFTIEDLNTLTGSRQHRKATKYDSLAEAEDVARGKAARSRSFAQFNVLDARGNIAFSVSGTQ